MTRLSRRALTGAAPLLVLALQACGASSANRADEGCATLAGRMSASAIRSAVTCYTTTLAPAEAAASCRLIRDVADRADAQGLGDAAACVLSADERADGAWFAELISMVAERPDAVDALIAAMSAEFNPAQHANSFSAGLTRQAQTALGERLASLPPELRETVVSVALQYALDPLSSYAGPYLRELEPTDDAVRQFAATVPNRGLANEVERWALAASGEWSSEQILACWERDGICPEWEGESPLLLLEVAPAADEVTPAPDEGVRILRRATAAQDELDAVARWLAAGGYPHREQILPNLHVMLTDPSAPIAARAAIAAAAQPAICEARYLNDLVQRVHFSDRSSATDASAPWSVFIAGCAATWDAPAALHALTTTAWLNVPTSVLDAIRAGLAAQTDAYSCEELGAMAEGAVRDGASTPSAAIVWPEVARAAGARCADEMTAAVYNVADDRGAHPVATLTAGLWLLGQDDDRGCVALQRAAAYRDGNDPHAPGPLAEQLRGELDALCR